jgi:hypothetical protein
MKIGILTRDALTAKHGTGAQLLRLLEGADLSAFHLYWWWAHGGESERQPSYRLIAPNWMAKKGLFRVFSALGLTWWKGTQINRAKLRELRQSENLQCDVVYAVVGDELSAQQVLSIAEEFGCPYVVHLMDLYEDQLDPNTMWGMKRLLAGASSVLVITEPLEREVRKFAPADVRRVFIGQNTDVPQAAPPVQEAPLSVLLSGRVYASGLTLLEAALPQIQRAFPQIRFSYVGPEWEKFPASLHSVVQNLGFVSDVEYRQTIADAHLAYLMGPLETDWLGKYSFPSRTSDYLMAGVPVLGCVGAGTATESVLMPLVPQAVRFTRTPDEICAAIAAFTESSGSWCAASAAALAFALDHLAMEKIRAQWLTALRDALPKS